MSGDRVTDTLLRAVRQRPGMGPEELANRVSTATRAPREEVVERIAALEAEGLLEPREDGGKKVYGLPAASPLELARKAEIDRINAERAAAERARAAEAERVRAAKAEAARVARASEAANAAEATESVEVARVAERTRAGGAAAERTPAIDGESTAEPRAHGAPPAWTVALAGTAGAGWTVLLIVLAVGA